MLKVTEKKQKGSLAETETEKSLGYKTVTVTGDRERQKRAVMAEGRWLQDLAWRAWLFLSLSSLTLTCSFASGLNYFNVVLVMAAVLFEVLVFWFVLVFCFLLLFVSWSWSSGLS